MPGLVKIGFTKDQLVNRINSLSSSSVPLPFECFCAFEVSNCRQVEQLLHDIFSDQRINSKREFFRISPERVRSALMLTGGRDVTPSEDQVVTNIEDRAAVGALKKRAANATFDMIKITPGTRLYFSSQPDRTCTVVDSRKVQFDNQIMSVSASALIVLHELGYTWQSANGWAYWSFDGKTLDEHFEDLRLNAS